MGIMRYCTEIILFWEVDMGVGYVCPFLKREYRSQRSYLHLHKSKTKLIAWRTVPTTAGEW